MDLDYLADRSQWDLGPKAAYVWFSAGSLGLVWVSAFVSILGNPTDSMQSFFRLPEPKVSFHLLVVSMDAWLMLSSRADLMAS